MTSNPLPNMLYVVPTHTSTRAVGDDGAHLIAARGDVCTGYTDLYHITDLDEWLRRYGQSAATVAARMVPESVTYGQQFLDTPALRARIVRSIPLQ